MDSAGAKRLSDSLIGTRVGSWHIVNPINHGKSAVVLLAKSKGKSAALKVFDPELVTAHGRPRQLERVRREQALRGHKHPHLVQILEGGECPASGHIYIVMALLAWQNLAQVRARFPDDKIPRVIHQIASAAKYLERRGFAHRDIKPENIAIDPTFNTAILLDLGVIRPIAGSSLTDGTSGREFIATLRYSSPTYLFRDDDDSKHAMKALTIYQLGGVLHDLLMKRELFEEHSQPWTRLVRAIEHDAPRLDRPGIDQRLALLCQNCLIKDDDARLRAVDWADFSMASLTGTSRPVARLRVQRRLAASLTTSHAAPGPPPEDMLTDCIHGIRQTIRTICLAHDEFSAHSFIFDNVDSDHGELRVALAPDYDKLISRCTTVCLRVTVLDTKSGTFDIQSATAFGGGRQCTTAPPKWTALFTGPPDNPLLRKSIEAALWSALDFAQGQFAPSRTSVLSPTDAEPVWQVP